MTGPTDRSSPAGTAAPQPRAVPEGWQAGLERDRAATLAAFRDGTRSPYAAVARHDFSGALPLLFGSAEGCDARLEGLAPQHLRIQVAGDHFQLAAVDAGATFRLPLPGEPRPAPALREAVAPASARVEAGRYLLRLSHQNFPAVLVLDPESPRLADGKPPLWFPADPDFRGEARLAPAAEAPVPVVRSTRGQERRALRLGSLHFSLLGQPLSLIALRLLEPGTGEATVSIFFRDQTSGHDSYPVGRYIDATQIDGGAPGLYLLDFNRAYNPACAFSPLYNCPIPPRDNTLPIAVRAGERDPGNHD